MGRIFMNYRREDSSDTVNHMYTRLAGKFGEVTVFRDVDTIPFGADFVYAIETYIHYSSVMLVVIGPQWLNVRDANGARRLDAPADYVRQEIEIALQQQVKIIPVLVQGAPMPTSLSMPHSLQKIAFLNAAKVRPAPSFDADMEKLFPAIDLAMKNWDPPSGTAHAIGTVEDVGTRRELAGRVEVAVAYLHARFLNPMTNQQETALIKHVSGYKIGDLIKLRFKPKWIVTKWLRGDDDWEID